MRETFTIPETAKRLGIGVGLCYELARRGVIPHIRLGRRVVVPMQALAAFLGANLTEPGHDDAIDGDGGVQ